MSADSSDLLTELFDIRYIQEFQDSFAGSLNVTICLVNQHGQQVTRPSNDKGFNSLFSTDNTHTDTCTDDTLLSLLRYNVETRSPAIVDCPHTGLTTAAIPVLLDGVFHGSWIFGQVLLREPKDEHLKNLADNFGISVRDAHTMFGELPRMNRSDFRHAIHFLSSLNNMLVRLGHARVTASQAVRDLRAENIALRQNNRLLRSVTDSGEVALYVRDFSTGKVILANEKFCEQFGLPTDDLFDHKSAFGIGAQEKGSEKGCPCSYPFENELLTGEDKTWIYLDQESCRWYRCTGKAVELDNGSAYVVTQMDITEFYNSKGQSPPPESPHENMLTLLNSSDICIFIGDLESDEVLWTNDACKMAYKINEPSGQKCHQMMHGLPHRCSFCGKPILTESDGFTRINRETGDNLIQWKDGRLAHIEYAFDVSERRCSRQKAEALTTTDLLTGTFSRCMIINLLHESLHQAQKQSRPVAVAFVDVDRLKLENDTHGHRAGDALLRKTADSIRECIRGSDIIGRIGGDEFVVIFPGMSHGQAQVCMERARQKLLNETQMTFSYGVSNSAELQCSESNDCCSELLNITESRMREYRRLMLPKSVLHGSRHGMR